MLGEKVISKMILKLIIFYYYILPNYWMHFIKQEIVSEMGCGWEKPSMKGKWQILAVACSSSRELQIFACKRNAEFFRKKNGYSKCKRVSRHKEIIKQLLSKKGLKKVRSKANQKGVHLNVVIVHIYSSVTGQRQTLTVRRYIQAWSASGCNKK